MKYAYYRDGTLPTYVVRVTVDGDDLTAESWDYKNKRWVLDGSAWETVEDERGNWALDEDYWEAYVQKMIERFPEVLEAQKTEKPKGAKRKKWW